MEVLNYMRLFVEVAKVKSFRRAAEVLEMPNSTLSRHIAELEKIIGLRLLHRSTRKVALTEAGQVYFQRCQSIVEEARIAHEALLDLAVSASGTLRVSMPVDLATDYLAPILSDFAKAHPRIDFEFDLTPRRIDLLTEHFDLAIRMGPPPSAPSTLVARQIALLPRYLYAAPAYLKTAPALVHPSDLSSHALCMVQSARASKHAFYCGHDMVEIVAPARFAMNSVGLSRALAKQGLGIAVLDAVLARDDVASGQLLRVLPHWNLTPVPVHAITETRLLPARTRLFIDFLKDQLHAHSRSASIGLTG